MKKTILILAALAVAGIAQAQNIPSGLTGLWRYQDSANKYSATLGTDLTSTANNAFFSVPWVEISPGLGDGGGIQTLQYNYLTLTHGIAPNGGGSYVNEYTVSIDYRQTSLAAPPFNGEYYNSLYQTATGNGNDGELFIRGATTGSSIIGVGALGYSAMTFDAGAWHRITWSVDNGSFFKVYIDGVLYLDSAGQPVDGRFSLDPTLLLFADNDGEDAWGIVATTMVWNRPLSGAEIAGMGGWLNGSETPTPLVIPEPATLSLVLLAGFVGLVKRSRR
jgi:hypothetical protein